MTESHAAERLYERWAILNTEDPDDKRLLPRWSLLSAGDRWRWEYFLRQVQQWVTAAEAPPWDGKGAPIEATDQVAALLRDDDGTPESAEAARAEEGALRRELIQLIQLIEQQASERMWLPQLRRLGGGPLPDFQDWHAAQPRTWRRLWLKPHYGHYLAAMREVALIELERAETLHQEAMR